jgi:hypothetical protein|tara:strand:+ start:310 stop:729 length:420 start_codon:yes stop_codon:yes gene_type:complete
MRNLNSVFEEAKLDEYSGVLDSRGAEARIVLAIKITRDRESGDVEILNTSKGGDYYKEISKDEYELFIKKGWRYGVYVLYLSNCRLKLNSIEIRINEHIQENIKTTLEMLQTRRKVILNNYAQVKNKLNQINNEQEHLQ